MTLSCYLPFYFQAAKNSSPKMSGLYILPFAMANSFSSILSGTAITLTRLYVPWMIASGAIMAIGSGLLYTLTPDSTPSQIIGYQLIASIGYGFGIHVPVTAMRNVLGEADVPSGNALYMFFQGLGGAVGLSIAQCIFLNTLRGRLEDFLPDSDVDRISDLGATNVSEHVASEWTHLVADAYGDAVRATFILAIAAAGLAFACSWAMDWRRLVKVPRKQDE